MVTGGAFETAMEANLDASVVAFLMSGQLPELSLIYYSGFEDMINNRQRSEDDCAQWQIKSEGGSVLAKDCQWPLIYTRTYFKYTSNHGGLFSI